jgi:hypothetical protein
MGRKRGVSRRPIRAGNGSDSFVELAVADAAGPVSVVNRNTIRAELATMKNDLIVPSPPQSIGPSFAHAAAIGEQPRDTSVLAMLKITTSSSAFTRSSRGSQLPPAHPEHAADSGHSETPSADTASVAVVDDSVFAVPCVPDRR